jgi:hypothetical protein
MAVLGALALAARPAAAELYYGFTVGVAKAPPAPVFRYPAPPSMVLASDAMVYVLERPDPRFDGDLFRYGQYWFAYVNGYWYRARSCSGRYTVIDVRNVPRAVIYVPRKHWRHHPRGPEVAATRRTTVAAVARPATMPVPRSPVTPAVSSSKSVSKSPSRPAAETKSDAKVSGHDAKTHPKAGAEKGHDKKHEKRDEHDTHGKKEKRTEKKNSDVKDSGAKQDPTAASRSGDKAHH